MPDRIRNILVTGSSGQLGRALRQVATDRQDFNFTYADRSVLDLDNIAGLNAYLQQHAFDAIINCAAYTAVDRAETEPELADRIKSLRGDWQGLGPVSGSEDHQLMSRFNELAERAFEPCSAK